MQPVKIYSYTGEREKNLLSPQARVWKGGDLSGLDWNLQGREFKWSQFPSAVYFTCETLIPEHISKLHRFFEAFRLSPNIK